MCGTGIVGDNDVVLFHDDPLLSKTTQLALCNDVDIGDGVCTDVDRTLPAVEPQIDPPLPPFVLIWLRIWELFSEVDIRLTVESFEDVVAVGSIWMGS